MNKKIFLVGFLFAWMCMLDLHAGIITYTNSITVSGGSFKLNAIDSVNDGLPTGHTYGSTQGIVTLGMDWDQMTFNSTYPANAAYTVEIYVLVKGWNPSGSLIINQTETLKVHYNPAVNTTELDRAIYACTGVRRLHATITAIKVNGIPVLSTSATLPNNLFLTTDVVVERYRSFSGLAPTTLLSVNASFDNQVNVSWSSLTGAEDYDIEWTYVDQYAIPQNYNFTNNSTRVTVPASVTSYNIPLMQPSGTLAIRVRGRGRDLTAPPYTTHTYGAWSISANTGTLASLSSDQKYGTGLEVLKNWQYTGTYAEEGKRKEVMTYFDGTLRNRQSITRLNSDNVSIIGQTIYDHIGRPAIQVLPVPDQIVAAFYNPANMFYRNDFNVDPSGNNYTYDDFDTSSTSCNVVTRTMKSTYGASKYYSSNNILDNTILGNPNNYIPDANGYPFTQIEYMPDNTNRIRRQGGVGFNHRLTGKDENGSDIVGKETKYYYATPFQKQLDRLFGNEVGFYAHYKKNAVIDANGQISVSYLDPQGRVIATALAGDTTNTPNLTTLSSAAGGTATLNVSLLDQMQVSYQDMSITATSTHMVVSAGQHSFTYTIATPSYKNCLPTNWCFDCIYDLTLSIKDECGVELVPESLRTQTVGTVFNHTCDSITYSISPSPLNLTLSVGTYMINKKLRVNQAALDYYTSEYMANSTCLLTLSTFNTQELAKVDTMECYGGCSECLTRLGTYASHSDTNQKYNPNYDYLTQAQYDEAKAKCNKLCEVKTPCDILYEQMINDVSPGGQYMTYNNSTYAVTDALSLLNIPSGALGDYAEVPVYHNADGSVSYVYIDNVQYSPRNLPVNLFVQNWQDSWAKDLVTKHPEYCYYNYCSVAHNDSSYLYDMLMMKTPTYEAAKDSGFLNPIATNANTTDFPVDHKDPFFYTNGVGNSLRTIMDNKLDSFLTVPTLRDLWGYIDYMQDNQINASTGANNCWTDYDWHMFRAGYLSKKQKVWQSQIDAISSCPNFGTYGADAFVQGVKIPRYTYDGIAALNNDSLMHNNVDISSTSTPQNIADEASQHIEAYCDTICNAYADEWMYRLLKCGMSDPDSLEIRFRLIEQCKGNCDPQNPMGGLEIAEIEEILADVLGGSYMDDTCNALLISNLPIVDHAYFGMAPMDTCACNELEDLKHDYDSLKNASALPAGICSKQEYFTYVYGSSLGSSMPDLALLECYCGFGDTAICNKITNYENNHLGGYTSGPNTYISCKMTGSLVNFLNEVENAGLLFDTIATDNVNYDYVITPKYPTLRYLVFDDTTACGTERWDGAFKQIMTITETVSQFVGNAGFVLYFGKTDPCDMKPSCSRLAISAVDSVDKITLSDIGRIEYFENNVQVPTGLPGTGVYLMAVLDDGEKVLMHTSQAACLDVGTQYCDTVVEVYNPPMVPVSLTCQQCLTCARIDTAYAHLTDEFPFIGVSTDSISTLQYMADYINQVYQTNFTYTQLLKRMKMCDTSGTPGSLQFCYEPVLTTVSNPHNECADFLINTALANAEDRFEDYKDSVKAAFRDAYIKKCLGAAETFTMQYTEKEFHYTLYYYDQAGNLIKTVPPAGVVVLTNASSLDSAQNFRLGIISTRVIPKHKLITNYKYTTLSQPAEQRTPDEGLSKFWYDILGRLVVSQNDQQQNTGLYSYTKYDELGRVKEVGQVLRNDTAMTAAHAANTFYLANWLSAGTKTQVTTNVYDRAKLSIGSQFTDGVQKNLRNRVAYVTYEETYNSQDTIYDNAIHYTYDIHGNVKEIIQDNNLYITQNQQFKKISYTYDLISGNVLEVVYQRGQKDQYYHKYAYDADNRLLNTKTSRENLKWDIDARYVYYKHGPLARIELGDNKVQGIDYAYTIHGWMKGINSNTLQLKRDMGADALSPSSHSKFARDAAGYSIGYYQAYSQGGINYPSDYKTIRSFTLDSNFLVVDTTAGTIIRANQKSLFNGNISYIVTGLPNCSTYNASKTIDADPLGSVYKYDQLNRIVEMKAFLDKAYLVSNNKWNTSAANAGMTYFNNYLYDANGNLTKLNRRGDQTGSNLSQDSLRYTYATGGAGYYNGQNLNRLSAITELQTTAARYSGDIDNNSTYTYDDIGNLISDSGEGINNIEWTVYGKVKKVTRSTGNTQNDLEFKYNATGQRILKIAKPRNSSGVLNQGNWTSTYYVHDAQGNIMTMYTLNYRKVGSNQYEERMTVNNFIIYGSSRLGTKEDTLTLYKRKLTVNSWNSDSSFNSITVNTVYTLPSLDANHAERWTGYKEYEVNNHLGNVQATVTDRKVQVSNSPYTTVLYWEPDINTIYDYYPFGAPIPGRNLALAPCSTTVSTTTTTIVNEQFASGTGGFTAVSGATLSNASGTLKIEKACICSGWGGTKSFSQINGVVYTVSFGYTRGTCGGSTVNAVIKNQSGSTITTYSFSGNGSYSFTFTGNETGTGSIEFVMSSTIGCAFNIDNVLITHQQQTVSTACASGNDFYNFGNGGQLKDTEIYGEGNSYTAEYWQYDSRLGRRWNVDPVVDERQSPYACFNNDPIFFVDPKGNNPIVAGLLVDALIAAGIISGGVIIHKHMAANPPNVGDYSINHDRRQAEKWSEKQRRTQNEELNRCLAEIEKMKRDLFNRQNDPSDPNNKWGGGDKFGALVIGITAFIAEQVDFYKKIWDAKNERLRQLRIKKIEMDADIKNGVEIDQEEYDKMPGRIDAVIEEIEVYESLYFETKDLKDYLGNDKGKILDMFHFDPNKLAGDNVAPKDNTKTTNSAKKIPDDFQIKK